METIWGFNSRFINRLSNKIEQDLATALARVEQSQLLTSNAGKSLLPSVAYTAEATSSYNKSSGWQSKYSASPSIAWQIDLWGELRRGREAQRAALLSTQWAARGVYLEIVSAVMTNYFGLLQSRSLFAISEQTLELRTERLNLTAEMYRLGAISKLDYNTTENLALTAAITLEGYRADVNSYQRALNVLLGENPHPIITPKDGFARLKKPKTLPRLMPVWIVESRPDVQQAYYNLMQSNAQIGVEVAKLYPSLMLNGSGGVLSSVIDGASTSGFSFIWTGAAQLAGSIFNWGTQQRNIDIAKLDNKIDYYTLEQAMLTAFKEVEVALGDIESLERQIIDLHSLVKINMETAEMTQQLYSSGVVDYLSLLDAQRELFLSQQSYVTTQSELLLSYITLYKSVGADWTDELE